MKLSNVRQIVSEDFPPEDRETISRLGGVLNYFMRQVVELSNGRVDFDNLAFELVTVDVVVDANGIPTTNTRFNSNVSNPSGLDVIRATNITNTATYPTNAPFISYTPQGSGIIKIDHVSGLSAGDTYRLVFIAV